MMELTPACKATNKALATTAREEPCGALIDEVRSPAIIRSFEDYNDEFGAITRRSRRRFEEREWKLGQRDAVERIELYDHRVAWCVAGLVGQMGSRIADQATWREIRAEYCAPNTGSHRRGVFQDFLSIP